MNSFGDGRGDYQTKRKMKNIERIKEWLKDNPNGTGADCAKDLGLSRVTVYTLKKEIENG